VSTAPAVRRPSSTRRWIRRIVVLATIGIVAVGSFVGWNLYRRHLENLRLREMIAELDARDPRWRLEDLEADRALVRDEENSANVIRAARARIVVPNVSYYEDLADLNYLDPVLALTDAQFRKIVDRFESNESAVAPALTLEHLPRGRHPITYTPDGISTLLRHVDDMGQVSDRVLRPLLLLHLHEGDATAAVRDCVCIVNIGRSIGDEPCAISQMQHPRFVVTAARGVERMLGQLVVSDEDLARLQAVFAAEAASDGWATAIRGERALTHRALVALSNGTIRTNAFRHGSASVLPARTVLGRIMEWIEDRYPPQLSVAHRWALRRTTRILDETSALPWHERAAVVAAIGAEDRDAPELARPWFETGKIVSVFQQSHAFIRCTLVAIAKERHRMRHGTWPDSPDELVPALLPEWPLDPFDGHPFRYKRLADGVVIYSVGADGFDDGGRVSPTLTQQPMSDIGVRVWDVDRRRQPPPDEEKQP
jgi:hypothetical protein